jgi:hypothetical protein
VTQFQRRVFRYEAKISGESNPLAPTFAHSSSLRIRAPGSHSQRTDSGWPWASSSTQARWTKLASVGVEDGINVLDDPTVLPHMDDGSGI